MNSFDRDTTTDVSSNGGATGTKYKIMNAYHKRILTGTV